MRIKDEIKHSYYVTFNISTDHTHTDVEHIPCDNFVFVEDDNEKKIGNCAHHIVNHKKEILRRNITRTIILPMWSIVVISVSVSAVVIRG